MRIFFLAVALFFIGNLYANVESFPPLTKDGLAGDWEAYDAGKTRMHYLHVDQLGIATYSSASLGGEWRYEPAQIIVKDGFVTLETTSARESDEAPISHIKLEGRGVLCPVEDETCNDYIVYGQIKAEVFVRFSDDEPYLKVHDMDFFLTRGAPLHKYIYDLGEAARGVEQHNNATPSSNN